MRLVMHSLVLLSVRCPFLTNVRYYDSDWLSFQSHDSSIFCVFCCVLAGLDDLSNVLFKVHYSTPFQLFFVLR